MSLFGGFYLKDKLVTAANEFLYDQLLENKSPSKLNDFFSNDLSTSKSIKVKAKNSSFDNINKKDQESIVINGLKSDKDDHLKTLKVIKIVKKT